MAMNITLNNKREYDSKTKFGKTYWDQQVAIEILEKAEKLELAKKQMKEIVLNSDIRKIEFDIQGSGDDGGIEQTLLFDYNGEQIDSNYNYTRVTIPTEHSPGEKCVTKPYIHHWNSDDIKNRYTVPEGLDDISKHMMTGRIISSEALYDGNGKKLGIEYFMYRENENEYPDAWPCWGGEEKWKNEFPKIGKVNDYFSSLRKSKHPIQGLMDYTYQLLPGGWEINEGSSSTVVFEYNDEDNNVSKTNYEDKNVSIDIEFNQIVYETKDYHWSINSNKDMHKLVSSCLDAMKIKGRTINLNSQAQHDSFYDLVDIVEKAMDGDKE